MDRRRTYIDVVERVLGSSLPSDTTRSARLFGRFAVGQLVIGSTVSEVQVYFFGDPIKDTRGH